MANFNRERIPERQPHAKGGGAFGHFEVTNDVSAYTKAAVFQPGTETDDADPVLHRGRRAGQPRHLARPARLRAEVLHREGNFDMVGNNTPVFFVRDPMKFQHFIRSAEAHAPTTTCATTTCSGTSGRSSPESAHQVTWLMGDRGIPRRPGGT